MTEQTAITKAGETHIVELNGQLYRVNLAPITAAQPQAITPHPVIPSPLNSSPQPAEVGGVAVPIRVIVLWAGAVIVGGFTFLILQRLFMPAPLPTAGDGSSAVVLEMLRQQNAQLQGQLGEAKGEARALQQQLQAKPTYERTCRPGGLFGWGSVCDEVRR